MKNELQEDVEKWILEWVSVYNSNLKSVPCPFAKDAMLNNEIAWKTVMSIADLAEEVSLIADRNALPDNKEIYVIGMSAKLILPNELSAIVKTFNEYVLEKNGYIALEDHPNDPEYIAGESMNQGKWVLVLIQRSDKLAAASAKLKLSGYYKTWSQENIDDVVTWREQKDIT